MSEEKELPSAEEKEPLEGEESTEIVKAIPVAMGGAKGVEVAAGGVMLRSLDDLMRFARMAVAGGAAPKGMSDGAAAVAIQAGLERGLGILGGLTQGVVINGVFSWRGQGAFALIQNSGLCVAGSLKKWTEGEGEDRVGIAEAHRVGYKAADRRTFSVKDARAARLWGKGGPWTDYPNRQLAWRALGFLARDVFPDVLGGFPIVEEAQDYKDIPPTVSTSCGSNSITEAPPPTAAQSSSSDPLMAEIAKVGDFIDVPEQKKEEENHG
jgi:hypothetical protein